jgi:GNAT superfamily N-acetyltransferase
MKPEIIRLSKEQKDEAERIIFESKRSNGYDDETMQMFADVLKISDTLLENGCVYGIIFNSVLAGTLSYYIARPGLRKIILEDLFIDPKHQRNGLGKFALEYIEHEAIKKGITRIELVADPSAKVFYGTNGYYQSGKKDLIITGRTLPVMRKDIKALLF